MEHLNSTDLPQRSARSLADAPQRPGTKSHAWIWILVIVAAIGLGYWYFHSSKANAEGDAASGAAPGGGGGRRGAGGAGGNAVIPVVAATARKGDLPVYFNGLGTVTAFNTVTVRSRVDGQIVKINFTEGQTVHQGEALAEIDPRPFEVQLEAAEGALAKDQAQLRDVQVNFERFQELFKAGVIPKQQVDTQGAQVGQFEGSIKSDQSQVDNAKLQLVYSRITAPITGRAGLRLVDVGNIIHAADTTGLLVITQLQPISVIFSLPQDQLPAVAAKLRGAGQLSVEAYDRDDVTKIATGKLATIDNQIDTTTGTYKLKSIFTNADNTLFPNQFVNVHLLVDVKHNLIIVPAAAIQRGPQGTYVYVVSNGPASGAAADENGGAGGKKGGKGGGTKNSGDGNGDGAGTGGGAGGGGSVVSIRTVTIAQTTGGDIGLSAGLNPGDVVVIDGQDKLQDGTRVNASMSPNGPTPAGGTNAQNPSAPNPQPGQQSGKKSGSKSK
ncbi:MAG TPA: MdtA/MuxA family multidrug efflux RND transporter periplasmic adaptor subunit [Candidatus Acidoferrum sp.]|jgi:multidrug efflux system membrane fusion protein